MRELLLGALMAMTNEVRSRGPPRHVHVHTALSRVLGLIPYLILTVDMVAAIHSLQGNSQFY